MPIIYTTPVSRADGADVVLLPTDLSVATGTPSLTNCVEGSDDAGFPDEIAPRPEDYVFLKRRPSAFHGTGVAELLRMLRRDTVVIGGGATNRGVETTVREAFSQDLASWSSSARCCWSGDAEAHACSLDKSMKMYAQVRTLDQDGGDAGRLAPRPSNDAFQNSMYFIAAADEPLELPVGLRVCRAARRNVGLLVGIDSSCSGRGSTSPMATSSPERQDAE